MKKILIIIPAYNEEANILKTCEKIINYNMKNKTNYDMIVINDGSIDNTQKILEDNNISHINLIHNLGIGGAVQTGYKYAYDNNYDIAIQFDGDGQHKIEYVKELINCIEKDKVDMSIGSRFIDKNKSGFKSSKTRRLGIKIISIFIKILTGKKIYDTTSGFRACNKQLIKKFAKEYPLEYPEPTTTTEILRLNYKILEIPVEMEERVAGVSSIHAWKNVYYMINVILTILLMKRR